MYPVIKGASYDLIHTPGLMMQQIQGRNPELCTLTEHLRTFASAVGYPPHQAFIGNILPEDLPTVSRPWYKNLLSDTTRQGQRGEIVPEDEFLGLMKVVDEFELVCLEDSFQKAILERLRTNSAVRALKGVCEPSAKGYSLWEIQEMIQKEDALPLSCAGMTKGCVRRGSTTDPEHSASRVAENIITKASAVIALQTLFLKTGLEPSDVDYVIEASEEACGDLRQKGGGGFAKSIAEACSCLKASGADIRAFCAAPVHALMQGAALVQSGIFKNVVVVAGGCSAKLGLNASVHIEQKMPLLEDMLGAFAFYISENDGINPIIRTDLIGRMNVGCGDSPPVVYRALVADPLAKGGYKITDIDRYAGELVNPELIEPIGCGDVAKMNYKMIASLGVLQGEFERTQIEAQIKRFGVPGFAPNQGHIPSGVTYIGPACELILQEKISQVMIIGKGSLFLGKLTHLYDAVSLIIQKNPGDLFSLS
ncbi:glycine/sarcosine/betaine reductase complex component C subunit beta [Desulfosporosinus youngiae]|uniref:3-oxoacyl-(Acyl-carrier-protein) synthase III n=1 Tax=Desulfosporosinus youngiae DSM 17734 TaxID=768710 RepID=H5Y3R2_9FIRM|nr:glycine/sarcosine/betaine reductase complex component C subunit beta [Desulfosporosinus youngiae]EHQ89306.1 3-oxoacyl-(acyl-carrier-protein) synthase III [Desulfosporosinus youngiae DSM 17734]